MQTFSSDALKSLFGLSLDGDRSRKISRSGQLVRSDHPKLCGSDGIVVVRPPNAQPCFHVRFAKRRIITSLAWQPQPDKTIALCRNAKRDSGGGAYIGPTCKVMWVCLLLPEAPQFRINLSEKTTLDVQFPIHLRYALIVCARTPGGETCRDALDGGVQLRECVTSLSK